MFFALIIFLTLVKFKNLFTMKKFILGMLMAVSAFTFAQQRSADVTVTGSNPNLSLMADVPLTQVPTHALQSLYGRATCSYNGSLTAASSTMASRLFRDAIPSTCAAPKVYPGNFAATVYYQTHTISNNTGAEQCVTITPDVPGENPIHFTAYQGSFDPTNLATNYLADSGSSSLSGTNVGFEVKIPAGQNLVIVANTNTAGQTGDYTIQVTGLNCGGGTPSCGIISTLTSADPTLATRLFRNGIIPGDCSANYPAPTTSGAGPFYYKTHTFSNNTGSPQCVTITCELENSDANVQYIVYKDSFNPANLVQNYLGDPSSSSGATTTVPSISLTVPTGNFIIVVFTVNVSQAMTGNYELKVTGLNCAGLATGESNVKSADMILYPNPTNGDINVQGVDVKSGKVLDMSGKSVNIENNGNTFSTKKLPKGAYILQVTDKKGNVTNKRFIKN